MPGLKTSGKWEQKYPGTTAGLLMMAGVNQPKACPKLALEKQKVEQRLRQTHRDRESLKALDTARVYNDYYKAFGWNYTVLNQAASIALKGKEIPDFIPLVTAMFTAELESLVLTAGHDLALVRGRIRLEVAQGDETYTKMSGEEQTVKPNDIYMADDAGVIAAILHGPDKRTRITSRTKDAVFCIYGVPGLAEKTVAAHLDRLEQLVRLIDPAAGTMLKQTYRAGQGPSA